MRKNQGGILTKLLISLLIIALEYKLHIKVVLRHSTLTLWADMKTNLFEYSYILMKTLEINEKTGKIKGIYLKNYSYLSHQLL